jgi:hypothetical protein
MALHQVPYLKNFRAKMSSSTISIVKLHPPMASVMMKLEMIKPMMHDPQVNKTKQPTHYSLPTTRKAFPAEKLRLTRKANI